MGKPRKTSLGVALAVALIMCSMWISMSTTFSIELGDFPAFYTGALLARQGHWADLHDDKLQARVQQPLLPTRLEPVFFVRPHIYAALLTPFALLPMRQSFIAWVGLQGAILIAIGIWACRRFGPDSLILIALFPPAILSIGFGQDAVVFLGIAVLSYVLWQRGALFAAGFILGCALLKPHLLILFPIALLLNKQWRMIAGLLTAGAVAAALSLLLAGWSGAQVYLDLILNRQGHLTPTPERMLNITSLMLNANIDSGPVKLALAAAILACVTLVSIRGEWWQALAAAQAGSLLIAPHTYLYDTTLLVLPALLVYFSSEHRWPRIQAVVCLTPLVYLLQLADKPWTAAPALAGVALLIALTWESWPGENPLHPWKKYQPALS